MATTMTTDPVVPASPRRNVGRWKLLAAMITIVLGAAYLVTTSMQTSAVYYLTVSELKAREASVQTQSVRVAGHVAPGSVEKIDGGLAIRFIVQDEGGSFPVYYSGAPVPDIFGEEVEVVVEGKLQPDGTFVAHTLLAKCASKFEE
jgi:cytochrome c-type biogenesis protein CcmE